jgi:AcrR family transcriptional regulator
LDEFTETVEKMVEQITKDEVMVREILATAKRLFAQHGLKKTTMEDIANALGKGKSTLYYYFPGKTEIFEAVVDEEMRNLLRFTRQAINMAVTAKDKLKAYCKTRVSVMEKLQNLSIVVYEEILNHIGTILQLKQKHDEIQIDIIKEIIKGGIQSGEFRELPENDLDLFSSALVVAFRGLELPIPVSKLVRSCERGADLLVDIMVDGISTNGLKYDNRQKNYYH